MNFKTFYSRFTDIFDVPVQEQLNFKLHTLTRIARQK